MADYQDVQIARRITRIIQGPDFSLINTMFVILIVATLLGSIASMFK